MNINPLKKALPLLIAAAPIVMSCSKDEPEIFTEITDIPIQPYYPPIKMDSTTLAQLDSLRAAYQSQIDSLNNVLAE